MYASQKKVAADIVSALQKGKRIITLVAPVQWGKTGVIVKTLDYITSTTMLDTPLVSLTNCFVITGLNDNEWKEQMKERVQPWVKDHVYHMKDLEKMHNNYLTYTRNICIVIDECHIACGIDQTISKFLYRHKLLLEEDMLRKNVYIIQVSATPSNLLFQSEQYKTIYNKTIVVGKTLSYCGFDTMLKYNKIKHLNNIRNKRELDIIFQTIRHISIPKYHIIRCRKSPRHRNDPIEDKMIDMCSRYKLKYIFHNHKNSIQNPNQLLEITPSEHTIIFIKNRWKASKTIPYHNIGVCVDSAKDYNALVQGLPGRLCGQNRIIDHMPLLFCNLKPIEEYIKLISTKYNYIDIEWKSMNLTTMKNKITNIKNSYINIENSYITIEH